MSDNEDIISKNKQLENMDEQIFINKKKRLQRNKSTSDQQKQRYRHKEGIKFLLFFSHRIFKLIKKKEISLSRLHSFLYIMSVDRINTNEYVIELSILVADSQCEVIFFLYLLFDNTHEVDEMNNYRTKECANRSNKLQMSFLFNHYYQINSFSN
jgi:hypothetical protein